MTTKQCRRCGSDKGLDEFSRDRHRRDGRNVYCLECTRKGNRNSYQRNISNERRRKAAQYQRDKDAIRARNQKWRQANRMRERAANRDYYYRNRERVARWHKIYYEANRAAALLAHQRRRAAGAGVAIIAFTPEQLAQRWSYYGNRCWICRAWATATDHVKPLSKGGAHMLANLRPICKSCNSTKHNKWPWPVADHPRAA
ncbi:MAG: hypothetical protein CK431_16990 [Mycobacterium sp.]|nr:MAG: hypothetical protein CK431_16990 [Mycobacterium sp.]